MLHNDQALIYMLNLQKSIAKAPCKTISLV